MKKLFLVLAALTLFLAACGSSASLEPVEITIDMSEFAFGPNDVALRVGQEVTLTLVNVGQLDHELMIGRDVSTHDGMPASYVVDFFDAGGVEPMLVIAADDHSDGDDHSEDAEDAEHSMEDMAGHNEHEGFMALVQPGQDTVTLSFTVTEGMLGDWEMGCFLLDGVHYTSGMVGSLTVTN